MYYVGIDPGIHGAVAIVSKTSKGFTVEAIHDMPVTSKVTSAGKTRNRIDVVALAGLLAACPVILGCMIEDVCSRPGEGAVNAFTFGHGLGSIEAACRLTGAEVSMVLPRAWKAAYGLTADKGESRHLAQVLTGSVEPFRRVKDDGRAEALLMAVYAASGGKVDHQGAVLEIYRSKQAPGPRKARKGEAPTLTGDEILAELKARVARL